MYRWIKKILAFCGFRCDLCAAYVNNIDKITDRATIGKGWNDYFGFDIPEERINCIGCEKEGYHLDTKCSVRPCAKEKQVKNCFFCFFLNLVKNCIQEQTLLMEYRRKQKEKLQRRNILYFLDHMKKEKN